MIVSGLKNSFEDQRVLRSLPQKKLETINAEIIQQLKFSEFNLRAPFRNISNKDKKFRELATKRKLESKEEPIEKKGKTELWFEQSEFEENLNKLEEIEDFVFRIEAFRGLFGVEKTQSETSFWLTTAKKVDIYITLTKGPYYSKIIDEKSFGKTKALSHHYLTVYPKGISGDVDDTGDPLLQLRFCQKHGEIVWIGKGNEMTGNDLAVLYCRLESALLNGISMYLYDDSRIESMTLKPSVIGEGNSWYERRFGFSIAKCKNWTLYGEDKIEVIHSQTPRKYAEALENVQKVSLGDLHRICRKYPEKDNKLCSICQRVFGENYKIDESTTTLCELVQKVSKKARDDKTTQALQDQYDLYQSILQTYKPKNSSRLEIQILQDLNTINVGRVLVKHV